jgi:integrase
MKKFTVSDLIQKFLIHHKNNSQPGTYKFYQRLENFKLNLLVTDLRPLHITEWVESTKGNYRRNLMRSMKTCFKWAADEGYIETSPLAKMKLPSAISRGDEVFLTQEQWEKIITAVDDVDIFDVLMLLHETGCRPGEVRAFEAKYFDETGKCIVFPKSESKGGKTQRIIHLNPAAMEIIKRRISVQSEGKLFSFSANKLDAKCEQLSKKVGVKFVPYSLRHDFCTRAIIAGIDLQTLSVLMGHCDLKMISKIYSHVRRREDFIKQELAKMSI